MKKIDRLIFTFLVITNFSLVKESCISDEYFLILKWFEVSITSKFSISYLFFLLNYIVAFIFFEYTFFRRVNYINKFFLWGMRLYIIPCVVVFLIKFYYFDGVVFPMLPLDDLNFSFSHIRISLFTPFSLSAPAIDRCQS